MTRSSPDQLRARFDRMFREHAERLYRYARLRLAHEDAEDLVCDVFLIAWDRLPEAPDSELAWLLGVARRTIQARHRSAARRRMLTERVAATAHLSDLVPDHARPVAASAELAWALDQLEPGDHEVLSLVLMYDLTTPEVALVQGCRRNTAAVRVKRARDRLGRILAEGRQEHAERPDSPRGTDRSEADTAVLPTRPPGPDATPDSTPTVATRKVSVLP